MVTFGGEQPSTSLFGNEGRVNHLVRNQMTMKNGRGWSRIARHGPLSVCAGALVPRRPRLPTWQPPKGLPNTTKKQQVTPNE